MSNVVMHVEVPKPTNNIHHNLFNISSSKRRRFSAAATTGGLRASCSLQSRDEIQTGRRSAGYHPTLWDFNFIQSLDTTEYKEERHLQRAAALIAQVKMLLVLEKVTDHVRLLELIDDLQRLGISRYFDQEILRILSYVYFECGYCNNSCVEEERDLYSTALAFRLLRDHGFLVSQEVFDCFKNEKGDFRSSLVDDTKGVMQLYEASFLLTQGEETLETANQFSTKILQTKICKDDDVLECVREVLELPIHWRIQWPNSRGFIEAYTRRSETNEILLQLAKLGFNINQAMHQQHLKLISTWWKETRLSEKLPFARDRAVECYLGALGVFQSEEYGYPRMIITKVNILITILDDIFDVYATLEELHLFNHIIQRWDVEAIDKLPNYMQIYFLTLDNLINEMANDVLKQQDILIIQHLRRSWKDLCTSFLQEAEWQAAGHTPTLNEYINNGWISSSGHVILTYAFFLITNPIHKEVVDSLYQYPDLVRCPSMLFRLTNDLATSLDEMERGEVAKSVQCYMKEYGASMEEGREHVKLMIWQTWKKMNDQERLVIADSHHFSEKLLTSAVGLGRIAHYMYQFGDGHGIQNAQVKDRISRLFFQPID